MSSVNPNTPSSPSCRTRARTLSYRPARACFCRSPTASKQSPTTMEKSSPLTSRSQPRWGRYPILPNPITRGNAASTNTPTAYSDSTSQKVQISLLCQIPMSKGSRINSTLAPERYLAIELLVRFSSTPKISPLHFAVEWARRKDAHADRSARQHSFIYPRFRRQNARGECARPDHAGARKLHDHGSWVPRFCTALSSDAGGSVFRHPSKK